MFGFLKNHHNNNELLSVSDGKIVNLSDVNDPVFNTGIMGIGYGIVPTDGTVYAPVSGKISMIADTKHGLGITSHDDLEILVHMGIDTVELKGKPFDILVKIGDEVEAGQKIALMNLDDIKKSGKDITTMVVITNSSDKGLSVSVKSGQRSNGELAATIKL
ncbi:PTS glucose transporter subunit IIA [Companilactobacillus allii]|uniref:PTS EIIA type-1 domain-containing protein n=1 Tax=Companilactobacillus allii TaxID=1847728 RepID=A0A1P8Q1V6_9LACO|nr:PTS glucose transporter subunit IIA [Companilactobacillus allii]APX71807.1 hypothetical protein BTM29_04215 [Companilactobacillus allii]USQ68894.1 PTS glucose transporter subunit IIA [Companilactobacillus allii]